MSALSKYLTSSGRLPEDALLGYIALSTGADGEHDRDALIEAFRQNDLEHVRVPDTTGAVNAFKKATGGRNEKYQFPLSAQVTAVIRLEEVSVLNPEVIARQVMRHKRDDGGHRLTDWERLGEIQLHRPVRRNGIIDEESARGPFWKIAPDSSELERERLKPFLARIKNDYTRYREALDGAKVRSMILDHLRNALESVQLKPSVHFVPIAHADELHRFSRAISTLEGCHIDLVPLVDLADQRDRLVLAFREENDRDILDLIEAISKARNNPTPKLYARLLSQHRALVDRAERYSSLLGDQITMTGANVDVLNKSLAELAKKFLEKGAA